MQLHKLDTFFSIYTKELARAAEKYPDRYAFRPDQAQIVSDKMRRAVLQRTYNHDGYAFAWTCKALGIKHTRRAIGEFLTTP